jgi:hypothetical protein
MRDRELSFLKTPTETERDYRFGKLHIETDRQLFLRKTPQ